MVSRTLCLAVLVATAILAMSSLTCAQGIGFSGAGYGADAACSDPGAQGFWGALGLRKYINSFTSWQFSRPGGPQDPWSRLEYPWEQVFGVVKAGWAFSTFGIKAEFASTALTPSSLRSQDSDWELDANPGQKTTFSQSNAKPRGWTFDLSTTIPCPSIAGCAGSVRGVVGYRAQNFRFTATGGTQFDLFEPPIPLPGAGIEYGQTYQQWYVGGVADHVINVGAYTCGYGCEKVLLQIQADVAYTKGDSHDIHLRRPGLEAATRTRGTAWHVNGLIGLYSFGDRLRLDLEGDFMRIRTTGTIQQRSQAGVLTEWDGADVWSDQAYVGVSGRYYFASWCGYPGAH